MKTKTKTKRKPALPELQLDKDSRNEWRWRVVKLGKVIAVSSTTYKRKRACINCALITQLAIEFATWTTRTK